MAQIYDIRKKLSNKRPEVVFDDEHKYKINDTKNGVLIMQQEIKKINKTADDKRKAYNRELAEYKKALKTAEEKGKIFEGEEPELDEVALMKEQYEGFDNVIGFMLGEEAKEYLKEHEEELSMSTYSTLFNVIGAAIQGVTLEEFEENQKKEKEVDFR